MGLQIRDSDLTYIRSRLDAQRALHMGFGLGEAIATVRDFFHRVGRSVERSASPDPAPRRPVLWE